MATVYCHYCQMSTTSSTVNQEAQLKTLTGQLFGAGFILLSQAVHDQCCCHVSGSLGHQCQGLARSGLLGFGGSGSVTAGLGDFSFAVTDHHVAVCVADLEVQLTVGFSRIAADALLLLELCVD